MDRTKWYKLLEKNYKNEFGYDYVPEWHQDIVDIQNFYINNERNNIFVAFNESDEIISTIGIRHMIKILKSSEESIQMKKLQVSGDYLLIDDIGVVVWLQKCLM